MKPQTPTSMKDSDKIIQKLRFLDILTAFAILVLLFLIYLTFKPHSYGLQPKTETETQAENEIIGTH